MSKIFLEDIRSRRLCREPQQAEQLVEVPTIVSYSLLQRTMEQQTLQFLVVVEGETLVFKVFSQNRVSTATLSSAERISERIVEQIVDIPVSGGGLHDFCTGQSSSSVLRSPTDWLNTEDVAFQCFFFRNFSPPSKSAKVTRHSSARVPRHVSSSTSSACGLRSWVDDDTGDAWTQQHHATTHNINTSFHLSISLFVRDFSSEDFMWAADGAAHGGAARRRRERNASVHTCGMHG